MFEKSFPPSARPTSQYICSKFMDRTTTPRSFGANLPQMGAHIWQKAIFKHALARTIHFQQQKACFRKDYKTDGNEILNGLNESEERFHPRGIDCVFKGKKRLPDKNGSRFSILKDFSIHRYFIRR